MKTAQHETISNREFYFVLYMMLLYVIGWVIDVNGLFLSSYFNLARDYASISWRHCWTIRYVY